MFYLKCKKKKKAAAGSELEFEEKTSGAAVIMMKCIRLDKLHSQQNDGTGNCFIISIVIGRENAVRNDENARQDDVMRQL